MDEYKKLALIVILFGVLQSTVIGQNKSMELTLWNWNTNYERAMWDKAVQQYNALNRPYKVSINYEQIEFTELTDTFKSNIGQNDELPDILSIEHSQWPIYKDMNLSDLFIPLNSLITNRSEELSEATKKEYTQNGNLYAISIQSSLMVFAYRADILENHNIEHPIKTWDNFLRAKKVLKSNGIDLAVFDIESFNVWLALYLQAGGKLFDGAGNYLLPNYTKEATQSFEYLKNLQAIEEYNETNITQFVDGGLNPLFRNGKLAGVINGDWILPMIKNHFPDQKGKWQVQPAPSWTTSTQGVAMGGTGYALVKKTYHDKTYEDGLKDFLNFSVFSFRMQAQYYKDLTLQMTNLDLAGNKAAILMEDEYFSNQKIGLVLKDAVKTMKPRQLPGDEKLTIFTSAFEKTQTAILNGQNIDEAIKPLLNLY